jgi:hypothetical protein
MPTVNLGRVRMKWRGEWAGSTAYAKDDIVRHGVDTYVVTTAHTSHATTFSNDSANWELMAQGSDIPSQSGQSGKVLKTDGSTLSWGDGLPAGGTAGQTLESDGNGNSTWASKFKPLAWCVFDGGYYNTVQIVDSYNISSISHLGTGNYRLNFTNALPDDEYLISLDVLEDHENGNTNRQLTLDRSSASHSTTSITVSCVYWQSNAKTTCHRGYVMIFGDYE